MGEKRKRDRFGVMLTLMLVNVRENVNGKVNVKVNVNVDSLIILPKLPKFTGSRSTLDGHSSLTSEYFIIVANADKQCTSCVCAELRLYRPFQTSQCKSCCGNCLP